MIRFLLFFVFVVMGTPAWGERSQVDPELDKIRVIYLRLRNTDPQVEKVEKWRKVASDLHGYSALHRGSPSAAASLFDASIAYENLHSVTHDESDFTESVSCLNEIISTFGGSELVDDALVRKATLLIKHGDQTEARNALQIVVSDFKKGDQYQAALALLSSLDGRGDEVRARHEESSVRALDAPVIVLDPGHGGEDFGARGAGGLLEKDVALDVAHRVKSILEQEERARVVLTRNDDSFVPLSSRTTIANNSHAALFVSLHANASEAGNLTGLEVYYLDTEGDEAGKLLAERENHASEKGKSPPSDLAMMVSDLIQVGKVEDSVVLARTMESTISQQIQSSTGEPVRKLGVKKAPFYVLVGAHMPCILVEMLFIDNPLDERRLGDPVFREAFAKGVAQGIEKMLSPKKGTRG